MAECDPIDVFLMKNLETLPITAKEIYKESREDKSLAKIINALEGKVSCH